MGTEAALETPPVEEFSFQMIIMHDRESTK
jgi:hypothetical protein